jgi:hypothetical protein
MLGSLVKMLVMVGIATIAAIILTRSFEAWYNDCEARRRAKWERKHGGRYE